MFQGISCVWLIVINDGNSLYFSVACGSLAVVHSIHSTPFSHVSALTSCAFHPDGLICGTGLGNSLVRIWDVPSQKKLTDFEGHTGSVTSISFSENGYYLATGDEHGLVKLWDLRKLKALKQIEVSCGLIIMNRTERIVQHLMSCRLSLCSEFITYMRRAVC